MRPYQQAFAAIDNHRQSRSLDLENCVLSSVLCKCVDLLHAGALVPCCVTRCSAVLFVSLLAVSVGAVPHLAILFVLSCAVVCSCVPWCFLGQCVVALCAVLVDVAPCLGALRCLRHPVCYAASQSAVLCCALRWRLPLPFFSSFCHALLCAVLLTGLLWMGHRVSCVKSGSTPDVMMKGHGLRRNIATQPALSGTIKLSFQFSRS